MVRKNVYGSENCPAAAEKYVAVRAVFLWRREQKQQSCARKEQSVSIEPKRKMNMLY